MSVSLSSVFSRRTLTPPSRRQREEKVIKGPIETAQEITGKLRGQTDITELFWCRWQIELFFKWIKQHLRIKAFYGTTENAVKTQVWIAIAVYVLVAIVKKQLHLDLSLYRILQILSVTVCEKTLNLGALSIIQSQESERVICNQFTLFD